MNDDPAKSRRAQARQSWPGALRRLEDHEDEVLDASAPGRLVGMVWRLTLDAWAMSGRSLPQYARAEIPGRVVRPDDR